MPTDRMPHELDSKSYVQGRQYPCHVSFVNNIEIAPEKEYLFTTGLSDEVIFQWKV